MTDREVEKALECCACMTTNGCNDCPMQWKKTSNYACTIEVAKHALDYIKRLKENNNGTK